MSCTESEAPLSVKNPNINEITRPINKIPNFAPNNNIPSMPSPISPSVPSVSALVSDFTVPSVSNTLSTFPSLVSDTSDTPFLGKNTLPFVYF